MTNLQTLTIWSLKLVISNVDVGDCQYVASCDGPQSCQHCDSMCRQRLLQQLSCHVVELC